MKFIYFLVICLMAIGCLSVKTNNHFIPKHEKIKLDLSSDSGFLTLDVGLKLLNELKMSDSLDQGWDFVEQSDTIGKYYKSNESGNYIICIIDLQNKYSFETHVLIELQKTEKETFKVVAKERYVHGNYSCCWTNYVDGFNKEGNYFIFDYCGTGSGFCGASTYYFKNVISQEKIKNITDNYWSSMDEESVMTLNSTNVLEGDFITYHYRFETFERLNEDDLNLIEIDTFSIKYELKNNSWICNDKRLESLEF